MRRLPGPPGSAWRKLPEERKSNAGSKPWHAVVMFREIVLCAPYNRSGERTEYKISDRFSFMLFLDLGLGDKVPDAKTVWLYWDQRAQAGTIEALFEDLDGYLEKEGYLVMGSQIIDASIVAILEQQNSCDENANIKEGETPEGWDSKPAKRSQKDTDARWTKKHGKSHYGHKNHVNIDRREHPRLNFHQRRGRRLRRLPRQHGAGHRAKDLLLPVHLVSPRLKTRWLEAKETIRL